MTALDFVVPLFVPGERPEPIGKAAASGADAVIIDLEDAVAAEHKVTARASLAGGSEVMVLLVRVNGIGTLWHNEDMKAVSNVPVAGVILPKAELSDRFDALLLDRPAPILALIETARGIAEARQITARDGIARLVFGSIDFCADLGAAHTREALLAARSELVVASRLAGLPAPVDGVTTSIGDSELIAADARHALNLGLAGSWPSTRSRLNPFGKGSCRGPLKSSGRAKSCRAGTLRLPSTVLVDEPVRIRARALLKRAGN